MSTPVAMTYRELRAKLETFTDVQLDRAVRWWGEDRGGTVKRLDVIAEPYFDDDECLAPLSEWQGEEGDEPPEISHPAGSAFLAVD